MKNYRLSLINGLNYFNYFSEIEETFNRRRGKYLFLSPLDWALIEAWRQGGVPLHVVLRGIEKVFDNADRQPKRRRSVKSLMYCREEIEAQYEEWLERQVGKNGDSAAPAEDSPFSKEAVAAHLENAGRGIEAAGRRASSELRETLRRVAARLAELKTDFADTESLEESLGDLEKLVDESLLKYSENKELKNEIEKQMGGYRSKMDAEAYRKTFDLMLLKRLRERAGIPHLSLFYL